MDSLKAEVASVFRTVITGDRDQINQAIKNYRTTYGYPRFYLYQMKDSDGRNLLHYACMYNTDDVATWMLSLRDDLRSSPIPKISDKFGATAVMYAASRGMGKFVQEWIKQGADINTVDEEGRNILHYCCGAGEKMQTKATKTERIKNSDLMKQVARILIDNEVNYSLQDKTGMTPIQYLFGADKYLFLANLDENNIPKQICQAIYTYLMTTENSVPIFGGQLHTTVAVCFMHKCTVTITERISLFEEIVLKNKLNINELEDNGMTALHHLCFYEYFSEPYGLREVIVAKLLELGVDPNIKDIRGYTPLMCALEKGYVRIYDPTDPRSQNENGFGRLLKANEANTDTQILSTQKIAQNMETFKVFENRFENMNEDVNKKIKDMEVWFQLEVNKIKDSNEEIQMENKELKQSLDEKSKEVIKLKSEVENLNDTQKKVYEKLEEQDQEITKLKDTIGELVAKSKTTPDFTDAPTSSLLLSNVTLTDVCHHLEVDVVVTCLPDATLEDLQAAISKDDQKYKHIYLVTGSLCDGNNVQDLNAQYRTMIDAMRNKSKRVIVSSILPILEDEEVNAKNDLLNKSLNDLCQEAGCEFVDNNRTFKYGDGSINEDCFDEEGESLSEFGIKRLLRNLGLLTTKKKHPPTNI